MPSLLRKAAAAVGLLKPVFRARERLRALGYARAPSTGADGLPLPDRLLMVRVGGHGDWRQFYDSGNAQAQAFEEIAAAAGLPLSDARVILDWGCGCGRISRHLVRRHASAKIVGRDVDAMTVGWAARNLPGDYRRSGFRPPLDLADSAVDAAVSLSVFTHLGRAAQRAWIEELARVIRPGGLLLLTFMDEVHHRVAQLGDRRADLEAEGFAVTTTYLEGTNHMATFQTRAQLAAVAAPWFREAAARTSLETPLHQAVIALVRRQGAASRTIDVAERGG